MNYAVLDPSRNWDDIANELLREPNTGRMARLLTELNQLSVELREGNCDVYVAEPKSFGAGRPDER